MSTIRTNSIRWKAVHWLSVKATDLSGILLRKRRWKLSLDDFAKMPDNSLGKCYYLKMTQSGLTFKPNLIRHDIKHILLGYDMDLPDELRIHAFLIGNKSYNWMAIIYLFVCLLIVPEVFSTLKDDFKRGKKAINLKHIALDHYLKMDLNKCRVSLKVEPPLIHKMPKI